MAQPFVEPCGRGLIAAEPCPRELGRETSSSRKRMVLAASVLASSMAFIDGSALTVALPNLRADLAADYVAVQWVLNGYVLALAALTLIGGALADVYGKSRMLAAGCLLFGLTSLACALAPSVGWLIVARVAQGIAAAILTPASLALIGATFPRSERSRAVGVWAAASALTTAGGPVLGGWLTEAYGWRMVFWINPPVALLTVALLMIYAPPDRLDSRPFDLFGAAILAVSLAALAFALSHIGSGESASVAQAPSMSGVTVAILAVSGCVGLAAYAVWERISKHPMTPPRLAGNRLFVGLNAATVLIYAALSIMFFLVPFDLIERRGLTATDVGLTMLPFTLGVGLLSRFFGALADKIGASILLVVGALGAATAYAWMAFAADLSLMAAVIAPMTLLGISFAVLVAPLTASVLSSVDDSDEGLASGINNAVSRIAQLGGVALAAGLASFAFGYGLGLVLAALLSAAGAMTAAITAPPIVRTTR